MRVTEKGQVTIPKHIRDRLGIRPGSEVEFVATGGGVELMLAAGSGRSRRALLEQSLSRAADRLRLGGKGIEDGRGYTDWLRGERDDGGPG